MNHLAGVLLQVNFVDADDVRLRSVVEFQFQRAASAERGGELADLVILWQVGVEVILASKGGVGGQRTVEGAGDGVRLSHGVAVERRQYTGIAEADGTDIAVRLVTECGGAGAKQLLRAVELDMNFQPDKHHHIGRRAVCHMRAAFRAHSARRGWWR